MSISFQAETDEQIIQVNQTIDIYIQIYNKYKSKD
jgi:hypothetical protein